MDWGNVCISHFNLALETAKLRRKTGSPKVVVLLFSSRRGPLFLLEPWNMHASWCMLPTIILVSNRRVHGFQFPFLSCRKNCFILFHVNGVQEELFQRSTTAMLQRPGAMFEFTGMWTAKPPSWRDKKRAAEHVPFSQKPIGPQNYQQENNMFYPIPTWIWTNQWVAIIIPHGTWSTLRQELAWILGQATNILKQETLNETGWIKHQHCIWMYLMHQWMLLLDGPTELFALHCWTSFLTYSAFHWLGTLQTLPALLAAPLNTQAAYLKNTIPTINFYSIYV